MRVANPNDADELARAHVLAWQQAYEGIVPDVYLRSLDAVRRAGIWRQILATTPPEVLLDTNQEDGIVGFASFGPARDEDCGLSCAELEAIYYLADYWGSSRAQSLWQKVCDRLKDQHYSELVVWVLEANGRAISFYGKSGLAPDGRTRAAERGGKELVEIRMAGRIS